jgi:hypothetical protein
MRKPYHLRRRVVENWRFVGSREGGRDLSSEKFKPRRDFEEPCRNQSPDILDGCQSILNDSDERSGWKTVAAIGRGCPRIDETLHDVNTGN